ncbi:carbohydrate ABC transporter permease [Saccharopolyspora sp. K220]|uniref:carbohydrate ABC transporter permease n=1 Tax=Saccharopolyspora soli TaxID=2926618 RepID=UPI001F55E6B5|nr:carbohydrate ABC transporter permease [Saccharopolyspora soli]MCI2417831.1 carbohydrate ABC transporter permease [Saccharopolyspora soli]
MRKSRGGVFPALGAGVWALVVAIPLYYVVVTSLRESDDALSANPLSLPAEPTLANYGEVLSDGFLSFLFNSVVVTALTVAVVLCAALLAAYVVVRGRRRRHQLLFRIFLTGLAIPLQATIIPVYVMIVQMGLYDSLLAVVLPAIAFALPLSVLILTNFLRDIPEELYESMHLEGAGQFRVLVNLVLPLSRPALMAVGIYQALQVWNGLLFPLILTQRPETAVLPLAIWKFQGQYTINIPAIMAVVVLSALPVLLLYILGRRFLVAGLTAGAGR